MAEVEVAPGQRVVDAATGAVVPLGEGVTLAQVDGSTITYTGLDPARTVQVWAEFTLRDDITWSDGAPVTADDSRFSFEVAASPDTPVSKFVVDRTASYEAVAADRLRWTGLPGWVDSGYAQRFWTPLPRHLYGALDAATLRTIPEANDQPLGWGPFVLAPGGWVKGGHLTVVRNPNYFRAEEGLPRVDRVTFRFGLAAEDVLEELEAGTCHVAGDDVEFAAHLPALRAAGEAGWLSPQFVADNAFEHLDFGILPAEDYRRPAGNDLFADVRVRQAVAHCLDRQSLIDQLMEGLSEVPRAYVPAAHPAFAGEALARYPFDPARGQALLEEAGWVDTDGDGVRQLAQRRLSVELVSGPAESAFREALLALISQQLLANCGMEAAPALRSTVELFDPWPAGQLFGRRFDLGTFPWRTGITPPCDLYLSSAIPNDQNPGGANNTGYSRAEFDAACQRALTALDEGERLAAHREAQRLFAVDVPSLPLFFRPKAGAALPRVTGFQLDSTAASVLWNVEVLGLE
jgi:peptide/nickel transport system substrate-binding protein